MDTLGVTSLRWLGIETVGGCLFVAYILLGVKGNDDDDKSNMINRWERKVIIVIVISTSCNIHYMYPHFHRVLVRNKTQ